MVRRSRHASPRGNLDKASGDDRFSFDTHVRIGRKASAGRTKRAEAQMV